MVPQFAFANFAHSIDAAFISFDPVAFKKTKHILRAAQFLRDQVARDVVTLRHARGAIMIADILTRGTRRVSHAPSSWNCSGCSTTTLRLRLPMPSRSLTPAALMLCPHPTRLRPGGASTLTAPYYVRTVVQYTSYS